MNLSGDITAQRFVVSSSVTKLVTITNSGSTAFGDSLDDTHIYTGSLQLTGSITASKFSGDGSGLSNVFEGTAPSASISTRLTSFTDGTAVLVSGSSTSTGSFGRVTTTTTIVGAGGVSQTARTNADDLVINNATTDGVGISILGGDSYYKSINFGGANSNRDAVISYSNTSDNKMTIGTTRASGIINFITDNGDVSLTLSGGTSGVISGSATSTGSFGELNIKQQRIYEKSDDLILEGIDGDGTGNITFRTGHGSGVRDVAHVDYAGAVVIGVGATIPADNHTSGGGSLTVYNSGTSIIKIANSTTGQNSNSGTDLQITGGTDEFKIINREAADIELSSNSNKFIFDASENAWSGS